MIRNSNYHYTFLIADAKKKIMKDEDFNVVGSIIRIAEQRKLKNCEI